MKKKLTLWIMLLPAILLAQTSQDSIPKGHHKKSKKVFVPFNPSAAPVPLPEEVKPDFSRESIFKALFVGGMNISQIEGSGEASYRKFGALVGGGTVIKFSKLFSVSAELLYSQKGARPQFATDPVSGQKDKFDISTDYVDLPITFSIHDKQVLMFGAGLQLSVLARYQQTDTAGNNVTSHPPEGQPNLPNGQQPHKVDLQGQICGTFFIKKRIGIGLRFSYSLLKIRDAVSYSHFGGEYNNNLSLRISYLLDPKHVKWNK
jgi:hypothetical protein